MAHELSHGCDHHHHGGHADHLHAGGEASKMRAALVLTVAFVICEAIAAWFADSLALLSDAGHNFADAAAVGFSWYALWIAQKPAHTGMTYGYHRVGILAALVNAVSLVVISLLIFWEAVERLRNPAAVDGWLMIGVSIVAIALNLTISVWLHAGAKHDLNVRSAYLHMAGDAVSALGVMVAGVVVVLGGPPLADAIASFLIGALILWSSWGVLKESVNVLLEGTPFGLDMAAVENAIGGGARCAQRARPSRLDCGIGRDCLQLPRSRGGADYSRGSADSASRSSTSWAIASASATRRFKSRSKGTKRTKCTARCENAPEAPMCMGIGTEQSVCPASN